MRRLCCPACQNVVYFENFSCLSCGAQLAFSPVSMEMEQTLGGPAPALACNNRAQNVCNWTTDAGEPFCRACRLNLIVPNMSEENARTCWRKIEQAKRRVLVDLLRFGLPIVSRAQNPNHGLAFKFLSQNIANAPVMTGNEEGVITLDIAEADDAEREKRRASLNEPYRTLVGHFRHEIGHYYWTLLLEHGSQLDEFREIFGDERQDYQEALKRHYENGPPPGWRQNYISAYATTHPWEDWAESFANFIHMVATLDTANVFHLSTLAVKNVRDPYVSENFQGIFDDFVPMTEAVNEINRSMGEPDMYPYVVTPEIQKKLAFIQGVIRTAAKNFADGIVPQ